MQQAGAESLIDFKPLISERRSNWIARRRDLHRHPELGFQEVRTAGIVAGELTRLGLEVQTGVGKTGVVGVLEGDADGPTVLVRADMDALPIYEENEVDYASEIAGHDARLRPRWAYRCAAGRSGTAQCAPFADRGPGQVRLPARRRDRARRERHDRRRRAPRPGPGRRAGPASVERNAGRYGRAGRWAADGVGGRL